MQFLKTHVYEMRVQFEDIDAGGYVHHPNYLRFIERARYQGLLDIDFGFERQLQEGETFVVAEMATRYLRPLEMGQALWILTRSVALRRSSLKVYQSILTRRPSAEEIVAAEDGIFEIPGTCFCAQARFVFLNLKARAAIELPSEARRRLGVPEEAFFTSNPVRRNTRLTWD